MTAVWLATGSTSTVDAVSLMAATVGAPRCFVIEGGYSLAPLDPTKRVRTRTLTLELFLAAPVADAYWATVRAIRRKLEQARRAIGQGDQWTGTPICLWMLLGGASTYVYWDVDSGTLSQRSDDFPGGTGGLWALTLNVLPYARGAPVTVATSATLTNGNAGFYVPNVAGDTDALCRLTLTDVSTGGVVINRVRLGRRSLPGMGASDFTPVVRATTATETLPTAYLLSLGGATGGTLTLTFGSQTTAAQPSTVTAGALQTAFTGLSSVGANNAVVSGAGTATNPFIISFAGSLATTQQGNITAASSLTGGSGLVLTRLAGAAFSDATALGGSTQRLTATAGFRSVGMAVTPAGALQAGRHDVWALVRDGTVLPIGKPAITSVTPGSSGDGTLNSSTITFQVTEIDAVGNESLPSDPVTATMFGATASAAVAFTTVGTPTSFRLYFKQDTLGWRYISGFTASPQSLNSNAGTVAGNPPTSSSLANVQLIPLTAINAPSPMYVLGRATTTALGNSQWEAVYLGTFMLPPMPEWEDQTRAALDAQILLQARLAAAIAAPPTIDFAGVWLFPHEEPQLLAEVSSLALTTPRTWVIDARRDGRASAVLTDGSGVPQGQASKRGMFTLGPGNNLIVAEVEVAGGLSDVVNAKYTLGIQYVPRYELPAGLPL